MHSIHTSADIWGESPCVASVRYLRKALPKALTWPERLVLAKSCGFDFVEMSIDETDERLSRLEWNTAQRASLVEAMLETGVAIPSMCLSAHRRFPFGSRDETVRERARAIMTKAIRLARDLGIRTIQLAGYDVYYEEHDEGTRQRFAEGWHGPWSRPPPRRSCWQWRSWIPRL